MHVPAVFGTTTLELRIHGIKNTPPGEMLGVAEDAVERVKGDALGAFWIEKKPSGPRGVRREAYSWGALARSGGGPLALVGQLFVHLGWFLILPFGLCNVAYWTRRVPQQKIAGEWKGGAGAASLRLFALALTLFYVTALSSVALDLIGVQCFRAQFICSQLPGLFEVLPFDNRGLRLWVLALIPLAAVMILFAISYRARVRYEPNISSGIVRTETPGTPVAPVPLLAAPEFWVRARVAAASERLHLAATLFMLSVLVAIDTIAVASPGCATRDAFFANGCGVPGGPLTPAVPALVCAAMALLGLLAIVILVWNGSETRWREPSLRTRRVISAVVLVLAALVFAGTGIVCSILGEATGAARVASVDEIPGVVATTGLEATPTILMAVLLALAVSGLGWRRGVPVPVSSSLLLGALLALAAWRWLGGSLHLVVSSGYAPGDAASVTTTADGPIWILAVAAAALVAIELVLIAVWGGRKRRARARYEGWKGTGPGVIMLLASGVAVAMASLLVVGFAAWLALPASTGDPIPSDTAALDGMWRDDGVQLNTAASKLTVPPPYVEFGFAVLVIVVVLALVAAVMAVWEFSRLRMLTTPAVKDRARPPAEVLGKLDRYSSSGPPKPTASDRLTMRVLGARRVAALAQRGEPLLGIIAASIGVGLAFTVMAQFPRSGELGAVTAPFAPIEPLLSWVVRSAPSIAIAALSAIALAAVAAIAANALTTKERPVGLMWDLICFLPRAGHPFGPPCYADRVVPEVKSRMKEWLSGGGLTAPARRVILSAHSLGAVLAVSSIFAWSAENGGRADRIGLLTYGMQLRPYFGRFFPELFGPEVLGTRPTRPPRLRGADPWLAQAIDDEGLAGAPAPVGPTTLVSLLTHKAVPAWINVWRRTDFLGFPATSYRTAPTSIDRGATEWEPKPYLLTIATHGHYPDVPQYEDALREVRRLVG